MTLVMDNVRVAITGGVRVAPVGTVAPTDTATAYAATWVELGWVSEDGIEEDSASKVTNIPGWQNGTIVRKVYSEHEVTFKFTLLETKPETWALYYPGSAMVAVAAGTPVVTTTTLTVKAPTSDPRAFSFDVIDGDKALRIIVPRGEVTDRGPIKYAGGEPIGFELTVSCYPDDAGVVMLKITDDAAFADLAA